jgi:hypothetical protein
MGGRKSGRVRRPDGPVEIEVRGPVGTADVVTVLASQVASLLAANAGPDGDPGALFDTMIRAQIDKARRMNAIEKERADG